MGCLGATGKRKQCARCPLLRIRHRGSRSAYECVGYGWYRKGVYATAGHNVALLWHAPREQDRLSAVPLAPLRVVL